MLAVGGEGRGAAAGLQGVQHGVYFGLAEYRLLERLDIADEANALGHVGWHFGFEGAAADEGDDRVQVLDADAKGGLHGFEVLVVLPQRVLEFEGAFVELLRPLRLLLAAEDPATHVLRFQHKDAVRREKYMVDLRGAVRRVQRDVVQAAIGLLIQLPMGKQPHQDFANMTLCPWGLEQADQQCGWDKPGQHAPDLSDDGGEVHFLSLVILS